MRSSTFPGVIWQARISPRSLITKCTFNKTSPLSLFHALQCLQTLCDCECDDCHTPPKRLSRQMKCRSVQERKHNRIGSMKCPRCHTNEKQYKAGLNRSKSQRYRCGECNRVYTPEPQPQGYSSEKRMLALRMYVEGSSQRSIGRILKVSPQTIANWINSYTNNLPAVQMPKKPNTAELDEMYTFLKQKKTKSIS